MDWKTCITLDGKKYTGNDLANLAIEGKLTPHKSFANNSAYLLCGHLLIFRAYRGHVVDPKHATHVEIDYKDIVRVIPGDETILLGGKVYTGTELRDAVRLAGTPAYPGSDAFWSFNGYDVRFMTCQGWFVSPFHADYIEVVSTSNGLIQFSKIVRLPIKENCK